MQGLACDDAPHVLGKREVRLAAERGVHRGIRREQVPRLGRPPRLRSSQNAEHARIERLREGRQAEVVIQIPEEAREGDDRRTQEQHVAHEGSVHLVPGARVVARDEAHPRLHAREPRVENRRSQGEPRAALDEQHDRRVIAARGHRCNAC